jgi:hypothetical protein
MLEQENCNSYAAWYGQQHDGTACANSWDEKKGAGA